MKATIVFILLLTIISVQAQETPSKNYKEDCHDAMINVQLNIEE